MYQQAVIAEQNKKLESASVLPDFNVGYFNQSLIGTQTVNGADVYFDGSKRFQEFNVEKRSAYFFEQFSKNKIA